MAVDEAFQTTKLSQLMGLVDQVRSVPNGIMDGDMLFPDIVVCGGQSTGKSSVLQALAGVNLPRSSSITTRVALRLSLMTDPNLHKGEAYAIIGKDRALAPDSARKFEESSWDELGEEVTRLTNELAGPLPAGGASPGINNEDMIFIRVVRQEGPQMTLVDLPGLSHHTEQIKKATRDCFKKHFDGSSHILLMVLSAISDVSACEARSLAREVDPDGHRTICVLTHMDNPYDHTPAVFGNAVLHLNAAARLGVFPVLTSSETNNGSARDEEDTFFAEKAAGLGLDKTTCGIRALGVRLMEKQSPIVENSLKALFSRTQKGLRDMTDRLDNFDIPEHNRAVDKRTIDTVLEDVQQEFEKFDRGAQEYHKPQCNIAMRSLIRYEKFRDDVNAIAPMWLADEYRDSTVKSHVKQFEGGDVRCQWTNPEIQLFKEAYRDKLEAKCMDLVGDVRNIVNDVLALLLDDKTKKLQRAKLCDHLKNLANVFLDKRLQKAREVVTYLCKAEMSKRATQDDTYERIQRKVKRLSQSAHDRSNPETFDFDHLPSNQVVNRGEDDDDLKGIDDDFIRGFYYRAVKDPVERNIVNLQLSLYSYSRTVTRRINDMVTMQAHLLLITSVYDREVYNNQDKQTFFDSNFVSEMREAIELMDAQAFQDLMTGSPEMEKERTCLKKDITAHEMVMHLLRQGGIGTI